MQEGFSFCGIDVATLGIHYAPDNASVYTFNQTWQPQVQTFEGFHGALYYGETVQPKEFRLRCYFEEQNVNEGIIDDVLRLFHRGKTGRLVFSTRPWLWYSATVISVDVSQLRSYRNGFITITLRAYYPFARCDYLTLEDIRDAGFDTTSQAFLNNSSFMTRDLLPETDFENITQNKILVLHNPGSEYASVAIGLSGEAGSGITITNVTTGDEAKFIAFTRSTTTNVDKTVICDALNGKTILTNGNSKQLEFTYHDHGFIRLAPNKVLASNIAFTTEGNAIYGYAFNETHIGKWINAYGSWYKITSLSNSGAILDASLQGQLNFVSDISEMNELVVTLEGNAVLDTLTFTYKPTFR